MGSPFCKTKNRFPLNEVNEIHKILPITKIVIEVAQFDTQKMKNHDISGSDYQNGEQLGFGMSGSTFCSETDINVVIVRESRKILF